ncbi:MAG: alpha/beta fold hydrolase [Bacteroidetes bacterium]|nr:alpha/beta fold hydrolase [Bacteroidota bacterium]
MNKIQSLVLLAATFGINCAAQTQPKFQHPEGKHIKVNGAKLWVETVGAGDPLFLISGGPGGAHVGMHSFDGLKDSCTLVYIDNFGRGKSDTAKSVTEYSISRDVEDIEGLRVAMKYEKINILGHSYGSLVAQEYAFKYPMNVKHLILANGFFSAEMWQKNDDNSNHEIKTNYPEVWEKLMQLRDAGAHSNDPEHITVYGKVPYGFLYAYNPENFRKSRDPEYPNPFNTKLYYQLVGDDGDFIIGGDIGKIDYRKQLKDLKMPVLIVAGRYDRVSVPEFAVQYKKYCPQGQFEMFERSGHNPQVEEPEKEFKIIKKFLAK